MPKRRKLTIEPKKLRLCISGEVNASQYSGGKRREKGDFSSQGQNEDLVFLISSLQKGGRETRISRVEAMSLNKKGEGRLAGFSYVTPLSGARQTCGSPA